MKQLLLILLCLIAGCSVNENTPWSETKIAYNSPSEISSMNIEEGNRAIKRITKRFADAPSNSISEEEGENLRIELYMVANRLKYLDCYK